MSVRKSLLGAADNIDQLALEVADLGVVVLHRESLSLELRGKAAAHLGFDARPPNGLQDILDRLNPADRTQLSARLEAWKRGKRGGADIAAQVSETGAPARSLRLRFIDRDQTLIIVTSPVSDGQASLLRSVSHALRSPLNALLGWVHVLALKRPEDEEIVGISVRLERSARALLRTVNDLQDLDHLRRGKFRIEKRPFQLIEAIEAAVQTQAEFAQHSQVSLVLQAAAGDTGVEGDPNRLRQLFEYLLRNAIQHSEPSSTVEIQCQRNACGIAVCIRDHGCGLSPAQLEAVFHGCAEALPAAPSGLGAGLLLSREIVARHGGSLNAASGGPGQGLTVTVSLPARAPVGQKNAG